MYPPFIYNHIVLILSMIVTPVIDSGLYSLCKENLNIIISGNPELKPSTFNCNIIDALHKDMSRTNSGFTKLRSKSLTG